MVVGRVSVVQQEEIELKKSMTMRVIYTADSSAVSVAGAASSCPSRSERRDDPQPPPIKVRASVFFDGTGNNLFNTRQRLRGGERYAWFDSFNGSFMNDYSNVAKLANYISTVNTEDDYHFSVYVEGIGTLAADGDDIRGSSTGTGGRGVTDRVLRTLEQLTSTITSLDRNQSRNIIEFKIDTFGFSRGAACSRHFGYRVFRYYGQINSNSRPLVVRLRDNGFSISEGSTRIKLMGLFDTVSSFGINHDNDVRELKLDFNEYISQIDSIVHIAAAEEFRMNFRITDCRSAGGKAQTIFLPGVHSDIGGGYNDGNDQNELNYKVFEIPHVVSIGDRIWPIQRTYISLMLELIRRGNYNINELVNGNLIEPFIRGERRVESEPVLPYIGRAVIANRRGISNQYSMIPLKIMAEKFSLAGLQLDPVFNTEVRLIPFLTAIYGILNNNGRSADFWSTATGVACGFNINELRHDYFHTSSQYNDYIVSVGYPMRAQFERNGSFVDLNENTVDNGLGFSRKRKVNHG